MTPGAGDAPARRSIATRTGDDGETSLLYGQRVPKSHPQVEAVGAVDELNAALGVAKAAGPASSRSVIESVQRSLVALMGEIACAESDASRFERSRFQRIREADLAALDEAVARIEAQQPPFDGWATPGATPAAAALDLARTAARRAERCVVGLPQSLRRLRPLLLRYLNRLSDLLWLMARAAESRRRGRLRGNRR